MTRFTNADDLRGADFREVSLAGSTFYDVSFAGASFREADFSGARMRGVQLENVDIDGMVDRLVINGVEVAPLLEAELDRRHPGRERLRSEDPDDLRAGWSWLEEQWAATTAAAPRSSSVSGLPLEETLRRPIGKRLAMRLGLRDWRGIQTSW